jgi:hypothetical protein
MVKQKSVYNCQTDSIEIALLALNFVIPKIH